jgi:DNA-binding XRE family transcriptional regulator/predicted RNase H-like HicB family nuclease
MKEEINMCIKLEGNLLRDGRYWCVSLSVLGIHTQGRSKKDAYFMIKDAVELTIDRPGFEIVVVPLPNNRFILYAKNSAHDKYLIAHLLRYQRARYGLSIADLAKRLGITKHAYAQYEQARAMPSITKVEEFIHAMSEHAHVVLDIIDDSRAA